MDPWASCRLMASPTGFASVGNRLCLLRSLRFFVFVFFVFFLLMLLVTEYRVRLDGVSAEGSLIPEGKKGAMVYDAQHPTLSATTRFTNKSTRAVDERNAGKKAWRAYKRSTKAYEKVVWWWSFWGG
jgi:hypothetical protein